LYILLQTPAVAVAVLDLVFQCLTETYAMKTFKNDPFCVMQDMTP